MTQLQEIKDQLPDYARDLKLNLSSVLTLEGAPGLSQTQVGGVALASAIASRNTVFTAAIADIVREYLDDASYTAALAAAAIMAMNNIYYRSLHLLSQSDYATMPARLRMNVIAKPGVAKADFELYCLVVSAINGCGRCLDAHEKELRQQGMSKEAVQSALRIASVVHSVAVTLEIAAEDKSET